MKKISKKSLLIIISTLTISISAILITFGFLFKFQNKNSNTWVLKTKENYVVLLNNGEIVEVFGDIVVNNLPKEDINHLKMGIKFLSKEEAMLALEDYDG